MWSVPKIVSQLFDLPPSVEKWKSVFPRAEIFPFHEGMEECRGRRRGKSTPYVLGVALIEVCLPSENQDRPDFPELPSRRGRYSITHVACQLSNKGQTRKKKEKREKTMTEHRGCRCIHATNLYSMSLWTILLQVVLKFREFKSMKVSHPFLFSLSPSSM